MSRNHCTGGKRKTSQADKHVPINLNPNIKHDSTCVSLKVPLALACDRCKPKMDPLSNRRRTNKKKERHKHERNRCLQYWHEKWITGKNRTAGHALIHRKTRYFLGIKQDVILENLFRNDAGTYVTYIERKEKNNDPPRKEVDCNPSQSNECNTLPDHKRKHSDEISHESDIKKSLLDSLAQNFQRNIDRYQKRIKCQRWTQFVKNIITEHMFLHLHLSL